MQINEKERFILEIIAGVILVTTLILGSILVVNASEGTEIKIENSFNTYNINTAQPNYVRPAYAESYIADKSYSKPYIVDRTYSRKPYLIDDDRRYLRYDSWSRYETVEGFVGNSIDKYQVYVQNMDYTGGYFKVIYHFEDYYGKDNSEAITYYIGPKKEQRYVIKDISPSRYDYRRWWYEVKPLTKAPSRIYNNEDRGYMRMYPSDFRSRYPSVSQPRTYY